MDFGERDNRAGRWQIGDSRSYGKTGARACTGRDLDAGVVAQRRCPAIESFGRDLP